MMIFVRVDHNEQREVIDSSILRFLVLRGNAAEIPKDQMDDSDLWWTIPKVPFSLTR